MLNKQQILNLIKDSLIKFNNNVLNNIYLTEHQDISNKVDKIKGKQLSTNDYTNEDKEKLDGLESYVNEKLSDVDLQVIDNLDSENAKAPLSANQGRILNNLKIEFERDDSEIDGTGQEYPQLTTTNKTITGAINEVKSNIDNINNIDITKIVNTDTYSELTTTNKTITSAINEVNDKLKNNLILVSTENDQLQLTSDKYQTTTMEGFIEILLPDNADNLTEIHLLFYTGDSDLTLIYPTEMKWQSGEEPEFETNKYYELMFSKFNDIWLAGCVCYG